MLSIVIPTFNRKNSLTNCLNLLTLQTRNNSELQVEILVTDDSTNNDTKTLIENNYPEVIWLKGPRRGPAANRNNGVLNAKGDWIIFTDDDCLPEPDWINEYLLAIRLHPEVTVFEGKTICKIGLKSPLDIAPINETGGYLWSCNFAIQKKFFLQLGGFNILFPYAHMEDTALRETILLQKKQILFIPTAIVDHPPRKMVTGYSLAKLHESEFFYYRKIKLLNENLFFKIIKNIVLFRIKNILAYKLSMDTFKAVYSFLVEVTFTLFLLLKWDKKYL